MKTILLPAVDEVSGQGPLGVNHVEPAEKVVQLDDINIWVTCLWDIAMFFFTHLLKPTSQEERTNAEVEVSQWIS